MQVETPFGTFADGTIPFREANMLQDGDAIRTPFNLRARFLVAMNLGGVRFKSSADTLADARTIVEGMDSPEGYSGHDATIYEWRARQMDGTPFLATVERYWFGELVDPSVSTRAPLSPLLDSDGPDYDPDAYVALVNA